MLACVTAVDVFSHILCEIQPSEFQGDELLDLEMTRVSDGFMVMAARQDGMVERVVGGNIDPAFVSEDVVIVFPVGEVGLKGSGNILQG